MGGGDSSVRVGKDDGPGVVVVRTGDRGSRWGGEDREAARQQDPAPYAGDVRAWQRPAPPDVERRSQHCQRGGDPEPGGTGEHRAPRHVEQRLVEPRRRWRHREVGECGPGGQHAGPGRPRDGQPHDGAAQQQVPGPELHRTNLSFSFV